jgi:hypothetical protein
MSAGDQFSDVSFAGHPFAFDGRHMLLGHEPTGVLAPGRVAMFGMTALALQDAFLVDLGWGWRLVEGIRQGGMNPSTWRICVDDREQGAGERAAALAQLGGIEVLSVEDGQRNLERVQAARDAVPPDRQVRAATPWRWR